MLKSAVANSSAQTISQHGFAEVVLNLDTKQRSLHSLINFKKNSVITKFEAQDIFSTPNYLTVQVGLNKHITLFPNFLQYINHSCNPNVFLIHRIWSWSLCQTLNLLKSFDFSILLQNLTCRSLLFVFA